MYDLELILSQSFSLLIQKQTRYLRQSLHISHGMVTVSTTDARKEWPRTVPISCLWSRIQRKIFFHDTFLISSCMQ